LLKVKSLYFKEEFQMAREKLSSRQRIKENSERLLFGWPLKRVNLPLLAEIFLKNFHFKITINIKP